MKFFQMMISLVLGIGLMFEFAWAIGIVMDWFLPSFFFSFVEIVGAMYVLSLVKMYFLSSKRIKERSEEYDFGTDIRYMIVKAISVLLVLGFVWLVKMIIL